MRDPWAGHALSGNRVWVVTLLGAINQKATDASVAWVGRSDEHSGTFARGGRDGTGVTD
jgi:hypothetical protein